MNERALTKAQARNLRYLAKCLQAEDQFPPINVMSEELGVSVNCVRDALHVLDSKGILARNRFGKFRRGSRWLSAMQEADKLELNL